MIQAREVMMISG